VERRRSLSTADFLKGVALLDGYGVVYHSHACPKLLWEGGEKKLWCLKGDEAPGARERREFALRSTASGKGAGKGINYLSRRNEKRHRGRGKRKNAECEKVRGKIECLCPGERGL